MTEKQDHDDDQRFKANLKKELSMLERRDINAARIDVGKRAVLYFGSYFGGLIFFVGLIEALSETGFLHLTTALVIAFAIMAFGVLLVVGAIFTSKIMQYDSSRHGGDEFK